MFQGPTEIEVYKLVLKARGLKLTVMTVLLLYLLFGEPEGEAALVKGEGLTVDAFVTERVIAGRYYALDLEGGSQRRLPVGSDRNDTLLPVPQNDAMCLRCSWK